MTIAAQALTGMAYVTLALVLWIGVHVVVAAIIVGLIGLLAFVVAWDSLRRRRRMAGSAPRP